MCINGVRQRGFTLIELILFIVVVSGGLAGIISVVNLSVQRSADPLVRKQAAALADSILEEILLMEYQDPDGLPNVVEGTPSPDRTLLDDVDDYNGLSITNLPAGLSDYAINIAVSDGSATLGVTAKKITVTVTAGNGESLDMTGYRAQY
ncbi:type IV pilus modification PilV family protein [Candidatus Methylobacter oryzae]|uniref:Pilus assembly protein MshD n=1 Tax=Candidatus Methylobacter oryzae TaxID=2497749 RepID=A0ABY3C9J0_9GAMM|nr:pilus assembly protein MshD [Candidatus Methylobacter oryzae]TRW94327.1 pilus assembly protein MshD [Candidatus Methylobacter oryzae]